MMTREIWKDAHRRARINGRIHWAGPAGEVVPYSKGGAGVPSDVMGRASDLNAVAKARRLGKFALARELLAIMKE